jgi:hypothetical protein
MDILQSDYFSPNVFLEIWNPVPTVNMLFGIDLLVESLNGHEFLHYDWKAYPNGYIPLRISLSGYRLLALSVIPKESTQFPQMCHIMVKIAKGNVLLSGDSVCLIAGYPDINNPLTWPNYNPNPWTELFRDVIVLSTTALAGANFDLTLPMGFAFEPIHISYQAITGAAVHNRYPFVECLETGSNIALFGSNTNAVINGSTELMLFTLDSQPNISYPGIKISNMTGSPLQGGLHLLIGLLGIQILDQLSNLVVRMRVTPV